MPIKRYIANKDSTITNAFREDLLIRAEEANMGESDVLETYRLVGQASQDSLEVSRIILQFPIEDIIKHREEEKLPQSGSVQFVLKLSNTPHRFTLPKKYEMSVNPVTKHWDEGYGLDMETYKDHGAVNWLYATMAEEWDVAGGDYDQNTVFTQYFEDGTEDLEVDITPLVEMWISGTLDNNGVMVHIEDQNGNCNNEASIDPYGISFYTKKFFARGTEFFFKRPWIEARYNSTVRDDRGNFQRYSPFVPDEVNYNTLYIHNVYKGKLYDLPTVGTGNIYVKLFDDPGLPLSTPLVMLNGQSVATGSWVSTGVYKAEVAVDTPLDSIYDIWFDSTDTAIGNGGEIRIIDPDYEQNYTKKEYDISIKRIKSSYRNSGEVRFHTYIRPEKWNPNSYTALQNRNINTILPEMYYRVFRIADNLEVIPYGTGSMAYTRLSYDKNGNYFDLDMSLLEPGYAYAIKFAVLEFEEYIENKEVFKFRVEE